MPVILVLFLSAANTLNAADEIVSPPTAGMEITPVSPVSNATVYTTTTTATSSTATAPSTTAGGTEPLALSVFATGIGVGRDTRGYLELFTRNGAVSQNSQAFAGSPLQGYFLPNQWNTLSNSGQTLSDPVVVANQAGFLDVFYVSQDLTIWHMFQTGYNTQGNSIWSQLYLLNGTPVPPALLQNSGSGANTCSTTGNNNTAANTPANGNAVSPAVLKGIESQVIVFPSKTENANNPATGQGIAGNNPDSSLSSNATCTSGTTTPPIVIPSTPASNMAAVLSEQGLIYLFYIGSDGAIWEIGQSNVNDELHWNQPASLGIGGSAAGHPTVITSNGTIYIFYYSNEVDSSTGNRGAIYYLFGNGAAMTPPIKIITIPSVTVTFSNITPAVNPDGRIELFYRGSDEGLWHLWQTSSGANSTWSPPQQLSETGGTLTSDPVAAINGNNLMQVFYRGTEGDIWTVIRNTDNGGAGQWSCRTDLVNSLANKVDIAASPITLATNQTDNSGALQIFYVGATNTNNGGSINNAAVDAGYIGTAPFVTPSTSNDIWTLLQNSAGSNPACPQNYISGWTIPASIGGIMVETISYPAISQQSGPIQPAGPLF